MNSHLNSIEDIIADERFLAWYFKTDEILAKEWKRWLSRHPESSLLVAESIAYLDEFHLQEESVPEAKINIAFERLTASLPTTTIPVVNIRSRIKTTWWASAAAVILLFVSGYIFWSNSTEKTILNSSYGEVKAYQLPDGSQVTLNAKTELALSKNWEQGNEREVWLKGEAFFKVQKTKAKNKFVVHTGTTDIVVTGTQFNVTTNQDETSVLLTEGSVTIITADGKELHMQPGDFVTVHNQKAEKVPVNEEKVLAWKQAKIVFDNTRMTEVAQIITKHYGVKVTLAEKEINEKRISGVMPNDSLDVLLKALEATQDFKIVRNTNEIVISKP